MKLKVALIYGGRSLEHEVSVVSSLQAKSAFDEDKYEVMLVYLDKNNNFYIGDSLETLSNYLKINDLLKKCRKVTLKKEDNKQYFETEGPFRKKYFFDLAFLLVHGKNVEDGTLHSLFSFYDIPYVGTTPSYAAISQDKVLSKMILEANHLSVVPYIWFNKDEYLNHEEEIINKALNLGLPLIVKAATLGSSIGVYKVNDVEQLKQALTTVINYDDKILIEKAIVNLKEINCALFKDENNVVVSDLEEVLKTDDILSYKDKYEPSKDKKLRRIIPAKIDDKIKEEVIKLATASYRLLNNKSIARIDFIIDKDTNTLYFNEINTIPGSLAFYLYEKQGLIYPLLIEKLINHAIKDYIDNKALINSYDASLFTKIIETKSQIIK
jgi:D-alanine-D-alanine ligase